MNVLRWTTTPQGKLLVLRCFSPDCYAAPKTMNPPVREPEPSHKLADLIGVNGWR